MNSYASPLSDNTELVYIANINNPSFHACHEVNNSDLKWAARGPIPVDQMWSIWQEEVLTSCNVNKLLVTSKKEKQIKIFAPKKVICDYKIIITFYSNFYIIYNLLNYYNWEIFLPLAKVSTFDSSHRTLGMFCCFFIILTCDK